MRSRFGAYFVGIFVLAGCAEAGNGATSTSTTGSGGSETTSATTGATGGSASAGSTGSGSGKGEVVINEVSATVEDWIELANAGDGDVDLGGQGLCDSDANGDCNLPDVVRFPKGTTLAAGERLIIVGNKAVDMGAGPFTDCLASGGPKTCFYASWKVSSSKGEKVHFIGKDDKVVTEIDYPMDAVPDGQTWGRLPDLTGDFAANKPTPGKSNSAP